VWEASPSLPLDFYGIGISFWVFTLGVSAGSGKGFAIRTSSAKRTVPEGCSGAYRGTEISFKASDRQIGVRADPRARSAVSHRLQG
jgi:hypothetical protein